MVEGGSGKEGWWRMGVKWEIEIEIKREGGKVSGRGYMGRRVGGGECGREGG